MHPLTLLLAFQVVAEPTVVRQSSPSGGSLLFHGRQSQTQVDPPRIEAEYAITDLERRGLRPDRVHLAGEHHPENGLSWRGPPERESSHEPVGNVQIEPADVAVA